MPQDILFISDLHLALDKPEITRRFVDFLQHRAPEASALYILGDLFDAWIGDDDFTPPNSTIRKRLKHLTDSGTKVYLQVGNRDFLLGQRFCQETGITLLGDYAVIDLFGTPTLLTHGDLLCTDDLPYQTFRAKARTLQWQQNVLSKPLLVRLLAARWFRLRSFFHKRQKSQAIMDVNADTVVNTLREYACLRLIHGHTHRPAVHDLSVDGQAAQRFVLAAWHKQAGEALSWNGGAYRREII
ncbi:UDP-2,3-diacylglucosamine diphosphatase [Methylovulum psychrotolerans]|uniref:UDP-2,3-diacylglucosamine hydrolase n=1 Tax=Methylovulum psychrotolerans TaxID=1704499 RepID=A0A2S5CPN4_9GAMM|nr:UDP-2,3-diacylglucosamine diphosphatase [Methylovulum psychrotolerans]POZ52753.1 UDP-2,3-diacylglucosamine diphosphatase [Methylovulum psychrotolerans]